MATKKKKRPPVAPKEAIAHFRARIPMTDTEAAKVDAGTRKLAFTVADVAHLDVVADVWDAIDRAITNGTTLEDFKAEVSELLTNEWGGESPSRLEVIFRTNAQTAYNAGRYAQMTDPEIVDQRPVWMFDAVLDSRTSDVCDECNGVKRPAEDPWWDSHLPPLHHNCRSTFIALTDEQAGAVTPHAPHVAADDGFGKPPTTPWTPDAGDYPAELWEAFNSNDD